MAQRAKDDVDPELLQLPRSRRQRHPLISVAVIGLSIYLLSTVYGNFVYFWQARTPVDLGPLPTALDHPQFQANRHVTIEGAPDRKHAVIIEGRFRGFDSIFRLLQSQDRVYVQEHRALRSSDRTVSATHTGRLVRLGGVPYFEKLRRYFAKTMKREHAFSVDELRRELRAELPVTLDDREGQPVAVGPDTRFWVDVHYPEEWVIQLGKATYPSFADAQKPLAALTLPYVVDDEPSATFWRVGVIARTPEQITALRQAFNRPQQNTGVTPRQRSMVVRADALKVDGEHLIINNPKITSSHYESTSDDAGTARLTVVEDSPPRIPVQAIVRVSTESPYALPDDALILVANEKPLDAWPYLALTLLLLGFILLNGALLTRHLRTRSA